MTKERILWLGVWGKCDQATNFYQRMGFEKWGQLYFNMGDLRQLDYLMTLELLD